MQPHDYLVIFNSFGVIISLVIQIRLLVSGALVPQSVIDDIVTRTVIMVIAELQGRQKVNRG